MDRLNELFRQVQSAKVGAFVPVAAEGNAEVLLDFEGLGRLLNRALVDGMHFPNTFPAFILAYLVANDNTADADRAAIGTSGEPSDLAAAEAEAEAVLETVASLDVELSDSLRNFLSQPIGSDEITTDFLFDDGDETPIADTRGGRAVALCRHVHHLLLEAAGAGRDEGRVYLCDGPAGAAAAVHDLAVPHVLLPEAMAAA